MLPLPPSGSSCRRSTRGAQPTESLRLSRRRRSWPPRLSATGRCGSRPPTRGCAVAGYGRSDAVIWTSGGGGSRYALVPAPEPARPGPLRHVPVRPLGHGYGHPVQSHTRNPPFSTGSVEKEPQQPERRRSIRLPRWRRGADNSRRPVRGRGRSPGRPFYRGSATRSGTLPSRPPERAHQAERGGHCAASRASPTPPVFPAGVRALSPPGPER